MSVTDRVTMEKEDVATMTTGGVATMMIGGVATTVGRESVATTIGGMATMGGTAMMVEEKEGVATEKLSKHLAFSSGTPCNPDVLGTGWGLQKRGSFNPLPSTSRVYQRPD